MMTLPHLLAGAAIGRRTRPGWLACGIAYASHFVLDHFPHLEPVSSWEPWQRNLVGYLDAGIAVAVLAWVLRSAGRRWPLIALCAFLADWPDIMRAIPGLSPVLLNLPLWKPMALFHDAAHAQVPCTSWLSGLWGQLMVVAISLLCLVERRYAEGVLNTNAG